MKKIKAFIVKLGWVKEEVDAYEVEFDTTLFIHKVGYNQYNVSDKASGLLVKAVYAASYKQALSFLKEEYDSKLKEALDKARETSHYKKSVAKLEGTCL